MAYKKEMVIVGIFSTVILFMVATYAFFSTEASSSANALSVSSAKFSLSLEVTPEFYFNKLIPMDDDLAVTGYNHDCVDSIGYEVCQAYKVKLTNTAGTGQHARLLGTINFNISANLVNLSYLLLDQEGNVYKDVTFVTNATDLSLGDYVELADGEAHTFTLVIWLSDTGSSQNSEQAGTFEASITYIGVRGEDLSTSITGTIN